MLLESLGPDVMQPLIEPGGLSPAFCWAWTRAAAAFM